MRLSARAPLHDNVSRPDLPAPSPARRALCPSALVLRVRARMRSVRVRAVLLLCYYCYATLVV